MLIDMYTVVQLSHSQLMLVMLHKSVSVLHALLDDLQALPAS